jgi:nucleoside-diphosphate-sugar epimerase
MRILVTGAGGFLGSAIARRLDESGHEVLRLHRKPREVRGEIVADLVDPNLAVRLPARVDLVVHAGAHVPEKEATAERDIAMATNAEATLRLLEYAVQAGARRFIHVSSAAVYGIPKRSGPVSEKDEPQPDNFYALSKLAGELMLESYRFVHGLETVGLRYSYVYGPGMRGSTVIRRFVEMARNHQVIPLLNGGRDFFDLVHLDDAVRALEAAVVRGSGLYNIGSGSPTTVRELAEAVIAAVGSRSTLEMCPATATYHSKFLDISKAATELGWRPAITLAEGVARL